MSKHRHKSRESNGMRNPSFNNNYMNNNPFGISPQQLLSLLGSNIDMNGLGNMLSTMGQEGFNLNSVNTQVASQDTYNDINNLAKSSEVKFNNKAEGDSNKPDEAFSEDDNIRFLQSIRNIVSSERAEFVDKIIELYNSGVFKNFSK